MKVKKIICSLPVTEDIVTAIAVAMAHFSCAKLKFACEITQKDYRDAAVVSIGFGNRATHANNFGALGAKGITERMLEHLFQVEYSVMEQHCPWLKHDNPLGLAVLVDPLNTQLRLNRCDKKWARLQGEYLLRKLDTLPVKGKLRLTWLNLVDLRDLPDTKVTVEEVFSALHADICISNSNGATVIERARHLEERIDFTLCVRDNQVGFTAPHAVQLDAMVDPVAWLQKFLEL